MVSRRAEVVSLSGTKMLKDSHVPAHVYSTCLNDYR